MAILSAPAVIGAQQQASSRQSGWPCGGRLDPSYFQVAEASGGHLLLLAPEEVGDSASLLTAFSAHPQTIFRLAGSVTRGLHEFQVPIDPSVDSVLFSISVQCLQTAEVVRPSGAPVGGDGVTDLSNFRAERMVIVTRPEPGVWTVRVVGSGVSGVVVQAQSAIGISQIEFAPAHTNMAFRRVPSAGIENLVRIRMIGPVAELRASLVSGVFQRLGALPLSAEAEGSFMSRVTPNAEGFRVVIAGRDPDGFAVQRMSAPLFTPVR